MQIVATSQLIYFIVSYIAMPEVITPPGELIYKEMSFFGFSDSKNNSCAQTREETSSLTSPVRKIILSFSRREKISKERSPLEVCSITIGTKVLLYISKGLLSVITASLFQKHFKLIQDYTNIINKLLITAAITLPELSFHQ